MRNGCRTHSLKHIAGCDSMKKLITVEIFSSIYANGDRRNYRASVMKTAHSIMPWNNQMI